jgi:hypothetical protein
VETMARLAKHKNIIGVKDATANLMRPSRERLACGPDWLLISGEDGTAMGPWRVGLHLGDGQCRTAALRGVPGGLRGGRFRQSACVSGPADAVA